MRKRKIILGVVAAGIVLNLLFLVNKERLLRIMALKLSGVSELIAADIDPDSLTIQDFSDIPGVNQEYVDAYKLFLKAKVYDKDKNTYDKAAAAFEKIAGSTKNPELKLRSLFLVTLCHFLEMKIDDAYESGTKLLSLCKELRKDEPKVIFLDKVVSAIQKGEISRIKDVEDVVKQEAASLGIEEVSDFADELSLLYQQSKEYREMKEKVKTKDQEIIR